MVTTVQFSHSIMSDSVWPQGLHHAGPPYPSSTPRVHSDSCPSSQWCHPAIPSSVVPFSSCPHSLPAAESFPVSQLFTWGGQRTGVSALVSFLPKKFQGWSPSEWTLFLYKYITVYSAILLLMHIYVVSRLTIINNMNDTLWAFLYKFSGFHFLDLGVKRPYHRIGACLVS